MEDVRGCVYCGVGEVFLDESYEGTCTDCGRRVTFDGPPVPGEDEVFFDAESEVR